MGPQQSIAHYRIVAKLGEGGMGEVWRAVDTKLNRDVAIKILPEAFAADPDRLARFTREAQVLASLNHPNIAAIYGVEERALVMELVEGPTLAERNAQGPMPLEEALAIAKQIAEALEYAHDKGIVHRDLKPANIKITPEGRVKVLDFGLASIVQPGGAADPTSSPTLTMRATQMGTIMGTAAYMSPEQARGQAVDRRADIWSFGVVLLEMLTGKMAFTGESISDTLASVLKTEPDWNALPPDTPAGIHRLLRQCLKKEPRQRLQAIGDARVALEEPREEAAAPAAITPPWRAVLPWMFLAGVFALATMVAAGIAWRATRPVHRTLLNMSVDLGPEAVAGLRDSFALSPDGTKLVYYERQGEGRTYLAIRDLSQPKGAVLSGTSGAVQPFFSPDGQWIGFFAQGKVMKMPLAGGAPVALCDARNPRGASWSADGRIVFAPESTGELLVVGENGGTPQQLAGRDAAQVTERWPQWLPGGDAILLSANSVQVAWGDARIMVWSQKTGRRKTLIRGGYYGRYLPGGYLVYVREGKLFGVRFNLSRLEISGQPVVLLEDVAGSEQSGGGNFDFAQDGLLVYLAGKGLFTARYPFGWMTAGGKVEPVRGVMTDTYADPHLSPDGKRLAMMLPDGMVALWDFEREAMTRLLPVGPSPWYLVLAPDGRHLIYATRGADSAILWRRTDGSGEAVTLLKSAQPYPTSISRDGRFLALHSLQQSQMRISILPIDASDSDHPKAGPPESLPASGNEASAMFSPDSRWLAYTSFDSFATEVYVRPVHGSGKWLVSSSGGNRVQWSPAARQLFYLASDLRVMVVDYSVNGDAFMPGKPRRFSDTPINPLGGRPCFAVAPDGKRILAFPVAEQEAQPGNLHATFLTNFFDEVKRMLP